MKKRFADLAPGLSGQGHAAALAAHVKAGFDKWGLIIKKASVYADRYGAGMKKGGLGPPFCNARISGHAVFLNQASMRFQPSSAACLR